VARGEREEARELTIFCHLKLKNFIFYLHSPSLGFISLHLPSLGAASANDCGGGVLGWIEGDCPGLEGFEPRTMRTMRKGGFAGAVLWGPPVVTGNLMDWPFLHSCGRLYHVL
jgi:hypothetical protein